MTLTQKQRDYLANVLREKRANRRKHLNAYRFCTRAAAGQPWLEIKEKWSIRAAVAKACADLWQSEIEHLKKYIRSHK